MNWFSGSVVSTSLLRGIDLIKNNYVGGNEKPVHEILTILYII